MKDTTINKFRAPLVPLNAPRSSSMAVDQGQLVQTFGEDIELAMRPAQGRPQLGAEGQKPAPCSGPGSEHRDRWSFQRRMDTAALWTDSG